MIENGEIGGFDQSIDVYTFVKTHRVCSNNLIGRSQHLFYHSGMIRTRITTLPLLMLLHLNYVFTVETGDTRLLAANQLVWFPKKCPTFRGH